MIRVLVVDDHPIVRLGLATTLMESSDCRVTGEAKSGSEALEMMRKQKPDVILLDIDMPGMSGLDVLNQVHAEMPEIKVLILSNYSEKRYAVRCLRAGAVGYIAKTSALAEVLVAIRKVMRNGKYISPSLGELLAAEISSETAAIPHEVLSNREFQVLCMLGQGNSVLSIAEALSLSPSTVNKYRAQILQKMNMRTTADLIRYALENRLTDTM